MSKTICFDLRALQIGHQHRGIGMHIRSILEHMSADDNSYVFYCFDKSNPIKELGIETKLNYTLVQTPTFDTSLDGPKDILRAWKLVNYRFRDLRSYNLDIFIQFDFMLGMPRWRKTKTIIIGYDLIPVIMRNQYMPSLLFVWRHSVGKLTKLQALMRSAYYKYRYALGYRLYKKADLVLCISKSTLNDFKRILQIPSTHLVSIPLAPVLPKSKPSDHIANKITKPYLFYIGGTDSRKRVEDVIRAFNIARGRGSDVALVLAGNEFKKVEDMPDPHARQAIMDSPYRSDIHLLGFVTEGEKLGLYKNAYAFIFASTYEGFGLPVIEAMAAECPVITYRNSSIPEAAGNAAVLVDSGDYVGIAGQIVELSNKKKRQQLITKGKIQANLFNWDSYANSFKKELESL